MGSTSLSSNSELSSALPQLPLLMQFWFVHNLSGDLQPTKSDSNTRHGGTNVAPAYLLHLSYHLVCHIGVTFGEIATTVNSDPSLVGGPDIQRTFRIVGVLFERRVLEVGSPLVNTGDTSQTISRWEKDGKRMAYRCLVCVPRYLDLPIRIDRCWLSGSPARARIPDGGDALVEAVPGSCLRG